MPAHRIRASTMRSLATSVAILLLPVAATGQCLTAPPATAETRARITAVPLSLEELVRLALVNNPVLVQAGFDIQSAEGRAVQAGLYPNPTVQVLGEQLGGRVGPGGVVTAPLVTQEIVTGGKLRLSRSVAQLEVDQATLALFRQRFQLLTAVRQSYFEVLATERRIQVLGELAELAKQSVANTKKILGAGEAAKPDLLQFQIELDRLEIEQESAQRELAASWRRLAAIVGVALPQRPLLGSLETAVPDYDFDRARSLMLEVHPDIRSAQVGVTRAQLALRRAQAEPIPNVTVAGGYTNDDMVKQNEWRFELGVPIPLFNRNQGNVRAALAELGRASQEIPRVENELTSRLATAFGQYAAARQRGQRYLRSVLPNARESYRLILAAFRGGQLEYLRVLQAQRAVAEANLTYIQALAEQWRAASEIAGLLQEEHWPSAVPRTIGPP